jgi:TolA-binding protein
MNRELVPSTSSKPQGAGSSALNVLRDWLACCICLAILMATGCVRYEANVPPQETAREQARIAETQYSVASQTIDQKMRAEEFAKAVSALDMVQDRFPDDRVYTPACLLLKGQIHFETGNYREAEKVYRRAAEKYADIEDIHASGLYGLGQSLYELGRVSDGQKYFTQLKEQYADSKSPVVRQLVQKANLRSKEIRTERKVGL